jgi:predicted transcriptional regulator
MVNLRSSRQSLGISQSKLARISGVSRFKICTFELGGGSLNPQECERIRTALEAEAGRIRSIAINPHFGRGGQQEMR